MGKIAALPIVGMVLGECAQAGLTIISKIAMSNGMSNLIFLCYSNALPTLILVPISLAFHKSERPPLTFSIISWFFLLGLIGFMAQFLGYAGIKYSSPTLSRAMLNLIPAFTFVLAVIFRMERIDVRSFSSLAKTLGTIVSISGAFTVTLYKGPPILNKSSTVMTDMVSQKLLLSEQSNWVLGGVCVAANCMLAASWLIVQGVFGSAFQVGASTWCLRRTGPVFVAMFKHLGIVVAVVIGVTFLGDTFYLGSLIGAVVIVIGFYSVMWGKPMKRRGVMMQGKEAWHRANNGVTMNVGSMITDTSSRS